MNKFEFSRKITDNKQEFTALNVEKLKGVLSYFSSLHENGEINDKTLEVLIRYAYSMFVENQVEILVEETLERKLMTFLRSKFKTSS
ncbi:MAG: hypothetical protein WBA41_03705 [Rivularia sp. (in: cyanobacteria)]